MARIGDLPELPEMQRAMIEIDLRLADVWAAIDGLDSLTIEQTGCAIRAAYARGLQDAAPASARSYASLIHTISVRAAAELRRARAGKKKGRR